MMGNLDGLRDRITRSAAAATSAAARDVAVDAAATAPVASGLMASKITSQPLELSGPTMAAKVVVNVDYAEPVILGARPHVISPTKPHGLLVFQSGGGTVFVHGPINHPGNRPNPFLEEAAARFGERVGQTFAEYMMVG